MKYSATIQFKDTKAQWTLTQIRRADGKGYTNFGLEAASFDEAISKTREKFQIETGKLGGIFAELVRGEPELIFISQEEPREHRTVKWDT